MLKLFLSVLGLTLLCSSVSAAVADPQAEGERFFDIRTSDEKPDAMALERLRNAAPAARARVAALAETMRQAEAELRATAPAVRIQSSVETGGPEIVGVQRGVRSLTGPSSLGREATARQFIERYAGLYGLNREQAAQLKLDASYANPTGNLEWVRLAHEINGLPVFRSEVTFALTPAGEIVRSVGQLAAGIDENEAKLVPTTSAAQAIASAAASIGVDLDPAGLNQLRAADDGTWMSFTHQAFVGETKAELVYFPLGEGALELAWSMVLWQPGDAHYTLVGASDGTVLFRKNITENEAFTYAIYDSASPAPFIPGPVDPTLGQQAPAVPRTLFTGESQITTSAPSLHPWLPPGALVTDGNNAEAGLDIVAPDGVDAPVGVTAPGEFNYGYNPPPGLPPPGDVPTLASTRNGTVVNLFYWTNRFHDLTYDLGFTEPARNFQNDNYGRGGVGGDRVRAEAQDSSGTNNANFSTPADGGRGRMQMYIWTGPNPDRDGSLDADIVIHELAHGLSNRLHGNASGLSSNMARGMGEGWSDFYAHAFLAKPTDPLHSTYSTGGYSTLQVTAGFLGNYYYGIRRFPKAVMSFTGGPNNLPHNPMTFADIDSTQFDVSDGAYPRGPIGSSTVDQVHNIGEIWSTALWEARGQIVTSLGFEVGNQRMLQLVTDGMKLSPLAPTLIDSRDAIIAADCAAFDGSSELDLWAGFAIRGMGFGAQVLNIGSGTNDARVLESFTGPLGGNLPLEMGITDFSNASCGMPGINPAPGDVLVLEVPVTNPLCGTELTNVSVSATGGTTDVLGTLAGGASATALVEYQIPLEATCGSLQPIEIVISHDLGTQNENVEVPVGNANLGITSFSNATPIELPTVPNTSGPANPYPSNIVVAAFSETVIGARVTLNGLSHTWPNDLDFLLVSPSGQKMIILSDAFGSDDAINATLELRDDALDAAPVGDFALTSTHAFRPTNHGANDPFDAPAPGGPYLNAEPSGAATFASAFGGIDPNGVWSLYIDDDVGSDAGLISGGWTLSLLFAQPATCDTCMLSVGGTVTGLNGGNSVSLQINGGEEIAVATDGAFVFPSLIERGNDYEVLVSVQPTSDSPVQFCSVINGSGTLTGPNIDTVEVVCSDMYGISGTLQGLEDGTSVTLQNNAGGDLVLNANGGFDFASLVADGSGYDVQVSLQPTNPNQTCVVQDGTGTVSGAAVTSIVVSCSLDEYSISGSLSGLAADSSVTLDLNGVEQLPVSANGGFTFAGLLLDESNYDVTVLTQPTGPSQTCLVQNGAGTLAGADVSDILVSCSIDEFSISGSVGGLAAGSSITLDLNGVEQVLVSDNGGFAFAGLLLDESDYEVTVLTQPTGPSQTCVVQNGVGTLAGADVSNILVSCSIDEFSISGSVGGLAAGSSITLDLNGVEQVLVSDNGGFAFTGVLLDESAYQVTILSQPADGNSICHVAGGEGTLAGSNVTDVEVRCFPIDLFGNGFEP